MAQPYREIKQREPGIDKSTDVIRSALNGVIAGEKPGQYILLGNWHREPAEPGGITACIVSVDANRPKLAWHVSYSVQVWVTTISRVNSSCYLLGTADGEIIRVAGPSRERFPTNTTRGIGSIWIADDDEYWLATPQGLSHFKAGKAVGPVPGVRLNGIHGLTHDFAIAVGMSGTVWRFDGRDWNQIDSVPTSKMLVAVYCVSVDEIYIGGWDGLLLRWNGKDRWTVIEIAEEEGAATSDGVSTIVHYMGEMYVGVGCHGLHRITGNTTKKVNSVYASKASVVDNKLVVTGLDAFAQFDGTAWKMVTIKL